MYLSRLTCMELAVGAIIKLKTINLAALATAFPNKKVDSAERRIRRFLKEIRIPKIPLAKLVAAIVGIKKRDSMKLVLDRTNWKFGKKHINILFLGVCLKGISIPLFIKFLRNKKSGNSNCFDRITLINLFIKAFGKKCVRVILGDREFIGFRWLKYLIEKSLPFCVRLQDGWQVIHEDGQEIEIRKAFKRKNKGKTQRLGKRKLFSGNRALECCVSGVWLGDDTWLIVAHSDEIEDACGLYRERWKIEVMFKVMKSSGFNLEDTHVTDPNRLETLTHLLFIVMAICYKSGELVITENPPKKKKHGGWPRTIIGYGLRALQQSIFRETQKLPSFQQLIRKILPPLSSITPIFVR